MGHLPNPGDSVEIMVRLKMSLTTFPSNLFMQVDGNLATDSAIGSRNLQQERLKQIGKPVDFFCINLKQGI